MGTRRSGILLHITSLPSPFGIGDFGPQAYAFADFLAAARQSYWQILPLTVTTTAQANSPYSSISAFAGNPLLISPEVLMQEGLLPAVAAPEFSFPGTVDYRAVEEYKRELFLRAFRTFRARASTPYDFERFCTEERGWLDDMALFKALYERLGRKPLREWPAELRERGEAALAALRAELNEEIEKERFLQYLFYRQWSALKAYCNGKGIQIIGDMPLYLDLDSADVWTTPSAFRVDEQKRPLAKAGSPPDLFSAEGQLLESAPYDWEALQRSGYSWWVRRMQHALRHYDRLRLDHFRGLVASWEVPPHETTAQAGKWAPAPADELVNTLLRHLPALPVIAEDLGVITPDVREVMARYKFPGIKVITFAFDRNMPSSEHSPHNYPRNSVACTGTHDTNTCAGWFENEATAEQKEQFFRYAGREGGQEVSGEMIRLVMMSAADTAIVPMQDVLGLGEEARMNVPASAERNWRWRLLPGQATKEAAARLAGITETYGRA